MEIDTAARNKDALFGQRTELTKERLKTFNSYYLFRCLSVSVSLS